MKIKTKLLVGLSLLMVAFLILAVAGWFQNAMVNRVSGQLERNYELASLSGEVQRQMKDKAIALRNMLLQSEPEEVRAQKDTVAALSQSIMDNLGRLDRLSVSSEQRQLFGDLEQINQSYNDYAEEVIRLVDQGNKAEAIRFVKDNGKQMQEDSFRAISGITGTLDGGMKSSLNIMDRDLQRQLLGAGLVSLFAIAIGLVYASRNLWAVAFRLTKVSGAMLNVASGKSNLDERIEIRSNDEIDDVARAFNYLAESLEEQMQREQRLSRMNQEQSWVKSNLAEMTTELTAIHELESFASAYLSKLMPLLGGCQAAFYMKQEKGPNYRLLASYAFRERKHPINEFAPGEGLVGQAALEKSPILLTNVPADHVRVRSGLGESAPLQLFVLPVGHAGTVYAVLEIASFEPFNPAQTALLEESVSGLGILLESALGRIRLARLLEESQAMSEELQAQAEELQSQQEELRASNEELEQQAQALRQSEVRLQSQQEELEQTNTELREKAGILEIQNQELESTNEKVERARIELEGKARELALSSRYKSEFLANMSHELRTPLNSLLILSKLLADNAEGNLTAKQVEFSNTVYSSGCDLLRIINDILDLAKVESGKMQVNASRILLEDLIAFADKSFRPVASQKKLDFNIVTKDGLPLFVNSDEQRVQQVLKNLLSNAFKFTDKGSVTLEVGPWRPRDDRSGVYFRIADTGIGIPKDKQALIFEAFRQADGTTSRKYGGTGLGLSICREITTLLGGEIDVESEERRGSAFTFRIRDAAVNAEINADARLLAARETAAAQAADTEPVRAQPQEALEAEAARGQAADADRPIKRMMIVDDDAHQRNSLLELFRGKNVVITAVSTGAEAVEELKVRSFDLMLLDLGLGDTTGFELLNRMASHGWSDRTKIYIHTGRDLTAKEEIELKKLAHAIIVKDAHSPQRLLDELDLFLQAGREDGFPAAGGQAKRMPAEDLEGKRVLLVDDDVRNVFAMSNILEIQGMKVTYAMNGVEALKLLDEAPPFDIVLMDIMMPEMDGYETTRKLRENEALRSLPVIALTAKAMKEDRDKCIEAGASDYIVKPVHPDRLVSLIRVWLHPEESKR
ncbi:response regulator [Cohnella sp. JJ-181]|uniref:response regulator n=1 Tax=Cohnella rhizoplanae TaxID=2974897 RepID=UPI0022FF52A7|nr:response regulator [Cohnella sp. JJ-181]CAI6079885.1 Sensor histidine kinase RcsC [Cohnella sp. JJ-181]